MATSFVERRLLQCFQEIVERYGPLAAELGHVPDIRDDLMRCTCGWHHDVDRASLSSFLEGLRAHLTHLEGVASSAAGSWAT